MSKFADGSRLAKGSYAGGSGRGGHRRQDKAVLGAETSDKVDGQVDL